MKRILFVAGIVLAILALTVPAFALGPPNYDNDPNDTAGPLDLGYIIGTKTASNSPVAFDFKFQDPVGKSDFKTGRLFIYFDVSAGSGPEYKGTIRLVGKHLKLTIPLGGSSQDTYSVHHPAAKELTVTVASSAPNPNGYLHWWVQTKAHDVSGCPSNCVDRAPNNSYLNS